MSKLQPTSLVALAREEVERRIYEGELADGERIVIDKVARELGISTVPLREALVGLAAQRLIKFEPNRGYSVMPPPDPSEMSALFDVRIALEIGALELITIPVPAQRLARLAGINQQIAKSAQTDTVKGYRAFAELNLRFHEGLIALAGAPGLLEMYKNLGYHQLIRRVVHLESEADLKLIAQQHSEILEALTTGPREVARIALLKHIRIGKEKFK